MSLPPGFLDEIRARVSLAGVIGRKLSWDQKKTNAAKGDYWACCPFHQEKTSSFHVDDRKGFYYCFGCHAKGDAFTFLKDAENMGFMEAVETLARDAGLEMPERDPREAARHDRRASLVEVMELAAAFFRLQLRAGRGQEARDYIRRRGLAEATVERFEIGFAPDTRNALRNHLEGKGVTLKAMDEAGLVIVPEDGGAPYDRFRGRVMFPIRDTRGRCIAFGGRALSADARAKYLNSPETALFDKGRTLFNHGPARSAAAKRGALVVAEGYMDVIALAEAGIDHAVAPLGTAITEDQLRLMWRIADEPVIALDGDRAGLKAAERLIDLALPLLEPGRSLRFALMPEGRDPDDLIRAEGPAAMKAALDRALPMVELLWRREVEGAVLDSPERWAALDKRLHTALATITDQNLRKHYHLALKERRKKLILSSQGTRKDAKPFWREQTLGARAPSFRTAPPTPEVKSSALVRATGREGEARGREAVLLLTLISHPALAERRIEALEDIEFLCSDLETLRRALISACEGHNAAEDSSAWLEMIEREIGESPLGRLMAIPQARETGFAAEDAGEDVAEHGFEETLARHRAVLALAREIAEAEIEMTQGAGEDLDRRLETVSLRHFREAAPALPESDDDESHLAARLARASESKIWIKPKGRRG
ncbi:DNA primase [Pikeienuella piscinae]|uniref:DNA primase n=1 Tax=Pikeienuella piscinae TaxID=2748098 RepID=A0A7L5C191_9RHOB|nr:DNA primase [Pikeienuella piscinae]QIE55914.1 DNA primase [Pikeienuella piscinae]